MPQAGPSLQDFRPLPDAEVRLRALEARLAEDLAFLNLPAKAWVPEMAFAGAELLDVAIIGAGLNGLCAAAALRLAGVTRIAVLDRAPAGQEGPWVTTARMNTLRTAKEAAGPALGVPSLTFRAWFEAQYGREAWQAMIRIPRAMWMDHMVWYRRVLQLPVRNGVEVLAIRPDASAPIALDIRDAAGTRTLHARRVVLATGIDGLGGPAVLPAVTKLRRKFWAHSSDPIDMAALVGKRVGVVGAGASAMDNAASALEAGAASVDLIIRRAEMPRVDKFTGIGSRGMALGYPGLPREAKWAMFHAGNQAQLPAPRSSVLRVSRHPNARFLFGCPILAAEEQGGALRVVTPRGVLRLDFLILATGFEIAPEKRPELAAIAPHIRRWSDVYAPPHGLEDAGLAAHPDLGPGFELQERVPGVCPGLDRIFCFAFPAVLSHGKVTSGIPSVTDAARRLTEAIARSLFVEDRSKVLAAFDAYDTPELLGDEWQPWEGPVGEDNDAAA
ncbi:FAD-dependent oxidoreductase [Roseomonas sp. AR75]|uniref:FAD-dependent oxidoreductase n=1 Tax=Roseomonas sp. AR75 TaxID=2562311 RepID=UPI0010C0C417|nr:NAD(P)/FAD-dependent oxidoreductase [Roseomonas sp. AR75]